MDLRHRPAPQRALRAMQMRHNPPGRGYGHSMRCLAFAAQTTLRHDILKGVSRLAMHQEGIASSLEPALCRLPGLMPWAGLYREGHNIPVSARENILLALRQVITVTDISVVCPLSINTPSAAAVVQAGAPASRRDQEKGNAYVFAA
jgi:hypothetical protein